MCDICLKAAVELRTFAKQLEEKYPGVTVKDGGEDHPVSPSHHAAVALMVVAEEYLAEEYKFELSKRAFEKGGIAGGIFSQREGQA